MSSDGDDGVVTLHFDDLCSSDPSVRANMLQSLEKVGHDSPTCIS